MDVYYTTYSLHIILVHTYLHFGYRFKTVVSNLKSSVVVKV